MPSWFNHETTIFKEILTLDWSSMKEENGKVHTAKDLGIFFPFWSCLFPFSSLTFLLLSLALFLSLSFILSFLSVRRCCSTRAEKKKKKKKERRRETWVPAKAIHAGIVVALLQLLHPLQGTTGKRCTCPWDHFWANGYLIVFPARKYTHIYFTNTILLVMLTCDAEASYIIQRCNLYALFDAPHEGTRALYYCSKL